MLCPASLVSVLLISQVCSYKILVFSPATSRSHLISNGRIADALAVAGHDVILLEPDFTNVVNITKTASHAKRWPIHGLNNENFAKGSNSNSEDIFKPSSIIDGIRGEIGHQTEYTNLCEEVFLKSDLIKKLKNEKFDAYFGEQINICGFGLAHMLGIRHKFWVSSCTMGVQIRQILGLENPTSYLPIETHLDPNPTVLQRADNLVNYLVDQFVSRLTNYWMTEMFRKHFGRDFPHIEDLAASSDIVFVATDELLDILTPTLSNVVHIGGLGIKDSGDSLDEKFTSEMSKGSKGVVLFSLGTIVNTTSLPPRIMESVLKIAASFPDYHFLIRADKHDKNIYEKAKSIQNVLVSDWLPQPAILAHPRLKLFITHAGYNGIMEAARAGVPLLAVPFMYDQPRNGRAVAAKGWGLTRTKEDLANRPEKIQEALKEILENPMYRTAAEKLQKLIRSRPTSPAERLVKTTEWVIQNGGVPQLKTAGRSLNFIVYYNLDVFALFVVLPVVLIVFLFSKLFRSGPVKVKFE